MAIIVRNRFPVDLAAEKAVGVDLPFNGPAVFKSNYLTRDAIKYNLINFFSTTPGERVFNPFFGSQLKSIIFQGLDNVTKDNVLFIISNELRNAFPFVQVQNIDYIPNEDFNTLTITITYQVANFGINDTINVTV
jgi:phage baseplate assembly protein W